MKADFAVRNRAALIWAILAASTFPVAARSAETMQRTAASGKDFCDLVAADFRMKEKDGAWVSRWATIVSVYGWQVSTLGQAFGPDYRTTRKMVPHFALDALEDDKATPRARCDIDPARTAVTYGLYTCTLTGPVDLSVAGLFPGGKQPKVDVMTYSLPRDAQVTLHMVYTFLQPNGNPTYQPAYCAAA